MSDIQQQKLLNNIRELLTKGRQQVVTAVNTAMVQTYREIDRLIDEDEQQGAARAAYGEGVLKKLHDLKPVLAEAEQKTSVLQDAPQDYLRDPYILDFLNLPAGSVQESELEQELINNLQKFLLELGKGFAFVERQQRICTDDGDYFIDLVFYNFHLKCFLLIDLKMHRLTHQDVGQMDMYVRMYEEKKRRADDNPTIGLILCSEGNQTVAKYSVLNDSKQLFASEYMTELPSEEELRLQLEKQRELLLSQQAGGNVEQNSIKQGES